MLESLITSRTRIRMLLKFFSNSSSTSYLRGLAEEFGESTNSIRHELNNLTKAGYLKSRESGRTIQYSANIDHPLYPELKSLVFKYLGIDKIVENIISKLGKLYLAFIIGDYAKGKDSGTVDLVLVGEIDTTYLKKYVAKAEGLIKRKINAVVLNQGEFEKRKRELNLDTALWLWKENSI